MKETIHSGISRVRNLVQARIARVLGPGRNESQNPMRMTAAEDPTSILDREREAGSDAWESLMIGFVQCRSCGNTWEALAYRATLNRLECPNCGTRDSRPIG